MKTQILAMIGEKGLQPAAALNVKRRGAPTPVGVKSN
jgi:hypothetical protein